MANFKPKRPNTPAPAINSTDPAAWNALLKRAGLSTKLPALPRKRAWRAEAAKRRAAEN